MDELLSPVEKVKAIIRLQGKTQALSRNLYRVLRLDGLVKEHGEDRDLLWHRWKKRIDNEYDHLLEEGRRTADGLHSIRPSATGAGSGTDTSKCEVPG